MPPRNALRLALVLAGAGIVVLLFLLLRPDGDDEAAGTAPAATETGSTTVSTATEPEPAATATTEEETTTAEPPPEPEATAVRILVRDDRVEGGVQRVAVDRGERVRLVVRADVADHVHLHGYDVMRDVAPGAPAQLVFEATIPGRFEVELEDRGLQLAEIEVRP